MKPELYSYSCVASGSFLGILSESTRNYHRTHPQLITSIETKIMTKSIPGHKAKKLLSLLRRAPGQAVETIKEKMKGEEQKKDKTDLPGEYVMPDSLRPGMLSDSSTDSEYEAHYIYRTAARESMENIDHGNHESRSSSTASSRAQSASNSSLPGQLRNPSIKFVPTLVERSSSRSCRSPHSSTAGSAPLNSLTSRIKSAFAYRWPYRRNSVVILPTASSKTTQKSDQKQNTPLSNIEDRDRPVVPRK